MLKQTQVGLQPTNLAVFPAVDSIFFFQFHHMENLQGVTSDGFHQPSCTQPHGPFGCVLHAPILFCLCPNQPGMGLNCRAGADFLGSRSCQKNRDAELLGGDKEVPGTISVPCLCCSVEMSSPDGSTGIQMYWRG